MNTFRLVALALMLAACGGAAVDSSDIDPAAESDSTEPAASPSAPSDPSPGTRDDVEPSREYSSDAPEAEADPVVEAAPPAPALPARNRPEAAPPVTPSPEPAQYLPPFTGSEPTVAPSPEPAPELLAGGDVCTADAECASDNCAEVWAVGQGGYTLTTERRCAGDIR
jgi:hypothetical protein